MYGLAVGNVFCKTCQKGASKQLQHVTNIKEQQKYHKYASVSTLEQMVVDTSEAFGEVFKKKLQQIAKSVALYKQKPHPILINRMRMLITAELQLNDAKMILASMTL